MSRARMPAWMFLFRKHRENISATCHSKNRSGMYHGICGLVAWLPKWVLAPRIMDELFPFKFLLPRLLHLYVIRYFRVYTNTHRYVHFCATRILCTILISVVTDNFTQVLSRVILSYWKIKTKSLKFLSDKIIKISLL